MESLILKMARPSEPENQEKIKKYKESFNKLAESIKSDINLFRSTVDTGGFDNVGGEEAKSEAQKKILRNLDKVEAMKKNLDSGNIPERDPEKEIDTTSTPKIPSWLKSIEENDISLGIIEWDKEKYKDSLFLSPEQSSGGSINGEKLLEQIKNKKISVLNSNVLDYLLEHKDEIPEEWKEKTSDGKTKFIYFWGTIFHLSDGSRSVRCLYWDGSDWDGNSDWLSDDWGDRGPAVRLA
jgi:hypothetical protein